MGGLALYALAMNWPDATRKLVASLPFVRGWMFDTVVRAFADHGAAGMLYGPSSGIPYKVYAVMAPRQVDAASFLLMSIPARLERLALSCVVFSFAGLALRRWWPVPRRPVVVAAYALIWCGLYALYWSKLG